MTELDKAVRQFRDVRHRNIDFIARVQRIARRQAAERLHAAAALRLRAMQFERKYMQKRASA